jgi:hypothetical protein
LRTVARIAAPLRTRSSGPGTDAAFPSSAKASTGTPQLARPSGYQVTGVTTSRTTNVSPTSVPAGERLSFVTAAGAFVRGSSAQPLGRPGGDPAPTDAETRKATDRTAERFSMLRMTDA